MPIPTPHADEDKEKFVSRCMGDSVMQEYEQDQRAAICYRQWDEKDKKMTEDPEAPPEEKVEDPQSLSDVKDGLVRIAIAYTGDFVKGKSPFSITEDDLKSIQKQLQDREVPMDYEHLSANPLTPPGGSRASGWIKAPDRIENFGGGRKILYGWAEFTPAMLSAIRSKEYKYFSPEIHWKQMDQTGKPVGTRLAAGAMTNRPFLKDLPPIEIQAKEFPALLEAVALSEHQRLMDVGEVHIPADIKTSLTEGEPRMKKLSMKLADGDNKGKPGIFDGETMVGLVDADELRALAEPMYATQLAELKTCMAELEELKKMKKEMSDSSAELTELRSMKATMSAQATELSELRASMAALKARMSKGGDLFIKHEGDNEPDADDMKATALSELVRKHRTTEAETICLTEMATAEPGEKVMTLAEEKMQAGLLTPAGFMRHQRIERMLDQAVREEKMLPKQRASYHKLAIYDFESVKQLLTDAKPAVNTKVEGIEGDGGKTASEELGALVTAYLTENKEADYAGALKEVTRQHPELWEAHKNEGPKLTETMVTK